MRVLLAAALLAGAAMPVSAEEITVRFAGKINYVHYQQDPFGVPDVHGPLATPLDYVYDLTFDTSIGTLTVIPGTSVVAGIGYSISPIRRWSLTINGVTDAGQNVPGDLYNNTVGRSGNAGFGGWSVSFDGGVGNQKYWAASLGLNSQAANSHVFSDPFVNQNTSGNAAFHHYEKRSDGSFSHLYWLGADVRSATVLVAANAVPEPGSWALMIAGLGLAGAAARTRRSVAFAC